jgi:hypothetical protein
MPVFKIRQFRNCSLICSRILAVAFLMLSFTLFGCESIPPVDDYTLARTALDAAKVVESGKYSPGFMHKAEAAYQKAQVLFTDRDYDEARAEFKAARIWAEKAENSARLIRFKNGEVL